jgi:hypothetical protein
MLNSCCLHGFFFGHHCYPCFADPSVFFIQPISIPTTTTQQLQSPEPLSTPVAQSFTYTRGKLGCH